MRKLLQQSLRCTDEQQQFIMKYNARVHTNMYDQMDEKKKWLNKTRVCVCLRLFRHFFTSNLIALIGYARAYDVCIINTMRSSSKTKRFIISSVTNRFDRSGSRKIHEQTFVCSVLLSASARSRVNTNTFYDSKCILKLLTISFVDNFIIESSRNPFYRLLIRVSIYLIIITYI